MNSLRVEQNGRVRRLTLARPERRNVLGSEMALALLAELAEAEADPGTGAILLDADGEVFCGGLDASAELPVEIFHFGSRMRKPVIAAVKGVAISAGVALIANAQIAVAAQGSTFGLTDIRDGCVHAGLLEAAAEAMGLRRTTELALTGRIFSTHEALSWGLIQAVAPAIEFEDRAFGVAGLVADADPEAVRSVLDATGFLRAAHAGR